MGLFKLSVFSVFMLVSLALTVFWILMLVDCVKRLSTQEKDKTPWIIWLVVLVVANFIGTIVYYFAVYLNQPRAETVAPKAAANPPSPAPGSPNVPPKVAAKCPKCGAALSADAPEGLCPRCLVQMNLAATAQATGASATASAAAEPLPSPDTVAPNFPQLEILECLGRGGMGVVYKARQPRLDRIVALKILAPGREKDPQFAERFMREARALAKLNHQNIVTIYDFGESGGLYFLLMEYVDGVTLRGLIQGGKLDAAQALAIVPRICEALQYAHEQNVVHRDIKPENVLVDKQGRVKLADFGIARIVGNETGLAGYTKGQAVVGTPYYMAPEQVEKPLSVDHRADIFSLGVVFYEMLTGELPMGRFALPSEKVLVDVRLDEVVLRALEKEPQRRYQQASHVKTDLETISGSSAAISAAPAKPRVAVAPSVSAPDVSVALEQVKAPALALRIVGILLVAIFVYGLLSTLVFATSYLGVVAQVSGMPPLSPLAVAPGAIVMQLLMSLSACGVSGFIIYGAGRMQRLQAHGQAVAASWCAIVLGVLLLLLTLNAGGNRRGAGAALVEALPVTVLVLAALGIGIWALVVLLRTEVRLAFDTVQAEQAAATSAILPRLSLTALAGAVWVGMFFVCALVTFLYLVAAKEFHWQAGIGPGGPNWVESIWLLVLSPALCAPLGATVLGWIAVGQIRRSSGRLYGLRLAVFDGLFFPLMLLDLLFFLPIMIS